MADVTARRALVVLHLTLAIVVIVESVWALLHALEDLSGHLHYAAAAGLQLVGALLFLVPRTVRVGGWILVATFGLGALLRAWQFDFAGPMFVYAAAALYLTLRGGGWRRSGEASA